MIEHKHQLNSLEIACIRNNSNAKGSLAFVEKDKDIPFKIARAFYIYNVSIGEIRGKHAHKKCHQFFICLNGCINVICDDGMNQREFLLDTPEKGLHLPPTIWSQQKYLSPNSILLCLNDLLYDESDYIRNYQSFLHFRGIA